MCVNFVLDFYFCKLDLFPNVCLERAEQKPLLHSSQIKVVLAENVGAVFATASRGACLHHKLVQRYPTPHIPPSNSKGSMSSLFVVKWQGEADTYVHPPPPNPTPISLCLGTIVLQSQRLLPPILAGHGSPLSLPPPAGLEDWPLHHVAHDRVPAGPDIGVDGPKPTLRQSILP